MQGIDPRSHRFDRPVDVDDLPEFHAARLLILMRTCGDGRNGLIRGRTKLAKLDFFVRYPGFLEAATRRLRTQRPTLPDYRAGTEGVEASMVRFRYGPWDHRYYNLLALLEGRQLIKVGGSTVETYSLTGEGRSLADRLVAETVYAPIVDRCRIVSVVFQGLTGNALKSFVYETFVDEVATVPLGTIIAPTGVRNRAR